MLIICLHIHRSFFHWDIWYDTVSLLFSSKIANNCQVIHQNRCQKWQTFPSPVRFVNITIWPISSCHTIVQKSVTVFAFGPEISYHLKKNISDLNLTKVIDYGMACYIEKCLTNLRLYSLPRRDLEQSV